MVTPERQPMREGADGHHVGAGAEYPQRPGERRDGEHLAAERLQPTAC
jgi:hypothetical protein